MFFSLNLHGRISAVDGYCLARNVARSGAAKPYDDCFFRSVMSDFVRYCFPVLPFEPDAKRAGDAEGFDSVAVDAPDSDQVVAPRPVFVEYGHIAPRDIDRDVARCRGAAACDLGGRQRR